MEIMSTMNSPFSLRTTRFRLPSRLSPPNVAFSSRENPRSRVQFSTGQTVLVAAFFSSVAAVLTASIAIYGFSNTILEAHRAAGVLDATGGASQALAKFRSISEQRSALRCAEVGPKVLNQTKGFNESLPDVRDHFGPSVKPQAKASTIRIKRETHSIRPHVAWLMSFPNR